MKISLDVMTAAIAAKKAKVNANFATLAAMDLHRDMAHALKLQWARSNTEADRQKLQPEADIRGISTAELREMILAKADDAVAARELRRQEIMARIEAAKTPADLDAI